MRLLTAPPPATSMPPVPRARTTTLLFVGAILLGSVLGAAVPAAGSVLGGQVDHVVLLLVALLFFDLRLDGLRALRRAPRTVLPAIGMNFLLIPLIAAALTLVVPDLAIRLGVIIYCLAPCTDWFLGFTRMARGDTTTGAALLPIQMVLQLSLYPIWVAIFTGRGVDATLSEIAPTLLTWFLLPAGAGLAVRLLLRRLAPPPWRARTSGIAVRLIPAVIAVLIVCLFAANVTTILEHPLPFAWVLLVVFLFFVSTYLVGEGLGRLLRQQYPEQALLTMTTSARNAPLMLAITTIALPGKPLVYAAIVLGMLIEFPHLTALTHLLRRREPLAPETAREQLTGGIDHDR